jgi:ribosomal protein L37AE/L43A
MYKCKNCGKEFPVVAWLEMATTTYPNFSFQPTNLPSATQINVNTNWQSTTTIKKPCCPYCQQLDLEEIPADKKS